MPLNTVTVTWDEADIGQAPLGGNITFRLSATLADTADGLTINSAPAKTYYFTSATGTSDPLVANDNSSLVPAGSYYTVTVNIVGQLSYSFPAVINFANGSSQTLAFLLANSALPAAQYAQYLPLLGGTMGGWLAPRVVPLTDAPVTLLNAILGNDFRWTIGGNHTLGAPSNPVDGQVFTVDIQQPASGGPFTPSFASGAGGYAFGADGQPSWSTAANAVDEVAFRFNATKNAWLCQGWKLGF